MTDMTRRMALALVPIALATATAKARPDDDDEKFIEFVNMYQDRMSSVCGISQDTLFSGDDPERYEEYYNTMWERFLGGADAVDSADDDMKDWPPEKRKSKQTAEEFRKEWKAAQARFQDMHGA